VTERTRLPPVVCFSNLDWNYLRHRQQHLMERIAGETRVIYVNPRRLPKSGRPQRWSAITWHGPALRVYEPPVLPGVTESERVQQFNHQVIASALRRMMPTGTRPVLWICSPHASPFTESLSPSLVVYDVADDDTAPPGPAGDDDDEARERRTQDALDQSLLLRADVVFCVSEPLREKAMAAGARNVYLLPNGCDIEAYADAPLAPKPSRRPKIGYVGTVSPRFDVELVQALAELRPTWSFEIVGPVSPLAAPPQPNPPNLAWVGEVPYAQVPARIKSFDACILPFREMASSHRSSPIQVYDYLAAGKPVVSSPVAQFEERPSLVSIARGAPGFAVVLDEVLDLDTVERHEHRRLFARENSWDARVAAALQVIVEVGRRSRGRPSVRQAL
jgi:UDP-galactopyranose mutase